MLNPISIEKNTFDRCLNFLNESSLIEGIDINYRNSENQVVGEGHYGAFVNSQQAAEDKKLLDYKIIRTWQAMITTEQIKFGEHIDKEAIGHIRGPNLQKNVRIADHIPPSWERVPTLFSQLIDDINEGLKKIDRLQDDAEYCQFLGTIFQRFERLHPFADGNGRTGRILVNYLATYLGRPIIIFPSDMHEKNRFYKAHKTEEAMCCHMAEKIQEAIFGIDGKIYLKEEELTGASVKYFSVEDPNRTETYEWHSLVYKIEDSISSLDPMKAVRDPAFKKRKSSQISNDETR